MIPLTKFNGKIFYLNEALIEKIEGNPDTVITLIGGQTYRCLESDETVVELIRNYQRQIYHKAIEVTLENET